jgi:hypothetical protein
LAWDLPHPAANGGFMPAGLEARGSEQRFDEPRIGILLCMRQSNDQLNGRRLLVTA